MTEAGRFPWFVALRITVVFAVYIGVFALSSALGVGAAAAIYAVLNLQPDPLSWSWFYGSIAGGFGAAVGVVFIGQALAQEVVIHGLFAPFLRGQAGPDEEDEDDA